MPADSANQRFLCTCGRVLSPDQIVALPDGERRPREMAYDEIVVELDHLWRRIGDDFAESFTLGGRIGELQDALDFCLWREP
jgi:hypothetical protein